MLTVVGHALQSVSQGVLIAGPDRRVIWANTAFTTITGYCEDEMLGQTCRILQGADTDQATVAAIRTALDTGADFAGEILNYRKDGVAFWNELTISRVGDDRGVLTHFVGITRDISERIRAEEALRRAERLARESQEQLNLALEAGMIGNWSLDLRTNVAHRSLRLDQCFGYKEQLRVWGYDTFLAHVQPVDRGRVDACFQAAMAGKGEYDCEFRALWPNGTMHWLWARGRCDFDEAGKPYRMAGFVTDITERKDVEQRIKRSEANLNSAQRIVHLGSWEFDLVDIGDLRKGSLRWSDEVFRIWGYEPGGIEVSYENFLAAVHPDDRGLIGEAIAKALRENRSYDLTHRIERPDGTCRTVREQAEFQFEAGTGRPLRMIGTVLDVTEQHEAQHAIRRALERLMEAQRIGRIGDWEWDVATQVIDWSPQVFEIFGRDPALGPPKNYEDQKVMFEPASWSLMGETVARVIETGAAQDYELVGLRPDGTRVAIQARAVARRGANGRVLGLYGTVQDITERKKLEAQFLRVQRQESVGTLAGGVAHDLNNILTPVLLVVPLLRQKIRQAEDVELLNLVEQSVQRGAKIVRQLLTFSRGVEGERVQVNIYDLIREMVTLMRETFPREITVVEEMPEGIWPIAADATQIHQVLLNLCVNARDAMPTGGVLTITVENKYVGEEEAGRYSPANPGPHLCLTLSDTGVGITRENLDRIFEPFFTTKEIGKGTGLGLSTTFGIVKGHGGFITVYSEPAKGTVFRVYLPAAVARNVVATPAAVRRAEGGGQLIMVVDDEPTVRTSFRLTLERSGYRVVTAANTTEALGYFTADRERIALVLTDIMMPGLSGLVLIAKVREFVPDVAIVAATGLHDRSRREELAALGVKQVLTKPCSMREVLDAVHRALEDRP